MISLFKNIVYFFHFSVLISIVLVAAFIALIAFLYLRFYRQKNRKFSYSLKIYSKEKKYPFLAYNIIFVQNFGTFIQLLVLLGTIHNI